MQGWQPGRSDPAALSARTEDCALTEHLPAAGCPKGQHPRREWLPCLYGAFEGG